MCWYVKFEVSLIDKRGRKDIEDQILGFKAKVCKKGLDKVNLIKGSMDEGFMTALHCDCDNIVTDKDTEGQRLLHYPALFEQIIQDPKVKNIRVWWTWGNDEPKGKEEKVKISEFLDMNEKTNLRPHVIYRILKENYV